LGAMALIMTALSKMAQDGLVELKCLSFNVCQIFIVLGVVMLIINMTNIVMLNVIMTNTFMLNAIIANYVMLNAKMLFC
jgi:hypothetical protein